MYLWKNFDLSIEDLVKELDKEQLMVLAYLTSVESEQELDDLFYDEKDFSFILKNIRQGKLSKKINKEFVEERIISSFEWLDGTNGIYETFYKHGMKEPVLHFVPTVYALYHFIGTLTDRKVGMWMNNLSKGQNKKETLLTEFEFFKTTIWIEGKPLLSSLSFIYFLAKIEGISKRMNEMELDLFNNTMDTLKEMIWTWFTLCLQENLLNKNLEKDKEKKQLQFKLEKQVNTMNQKDENIKKLKEKHRNAMIQEKDKVFELDKELSEYRFKLNKINNEWEEKYQLLEKSYLLQKRELSTLSTTTKKQEEQINLLKKEVKIYYKKLEENKEEKVNADSPVSFEEWLNNGEIYLKDTKFDNYRDQIETLLETYKSKVPDEINDSVEVEQIKEEVVLPKNRIGYCVIEENRHFVIYPNGEKQEILNISNATYFQPFQFVTVSPTGQFIKNYQYAYLESSRDYNIHQFGVVHLKEDGAVVQTGDNAFLTLEKIPMTTKLREGQLVSFDNKNQYIRFYFPVKPSLDGFYESMKARGQKPFVLLRKLSGGYILRDIITNEEIFSVIDELEKWNVEERQVILMQEDTVCQVFRHSKFYTLSSYYQFAEHASVKRIEGEDIFIEKMSGEIVKLLDKPTHIELEVEQVVKIDEYHNYLHLEHSTEMKNSLTDERKRLAQTQQRKTNYTPSAPIEIKKDVLIIGKITYEFNYKTALLKHGFRTNVVDGYEPWVKIKQASKQKDIIVVVEDFISHDNMYRVKDELMEHSIIYSEKDGANFIAEKINQL